MTAFLAIDENLRAAMKFFGTASGSGDIADLGGSIAIFSGLDYGVFNIGLLTRRAAEGELESRLNELGRFFRERTLRWSMWVCEDQLDSPVRRRERQIFANYGMRPISQPPGMLARELLPPIYALPQIEIRPVADAATRIAFTELTSLCFEIPYTIAHAVYSREAAWRGDYQGFVGCVEGKAVSIIAVVHAADVIGVYSLATAPGFRRRGYAEALLRGTVGKISERTGTDRVILQSTEAGYALYKRMGFADATRFTVYLTK
jgi:ribosomal protein S18 acetylase RimI-like enzyme